MRRPASINRTHARTHAHTHAYTRTHAHTHAHTRTHAHARTHTHARTRTTCSHAHTHARDSIAAPRPRPRRRNLPRMHAMRSQRVTPIAEQSAALPAVSARPCCAALPAAVGACRPCDGCTGALPRARAALRCTAYRAHNHGCAYTYGHPTAAKRMGRWRRV